MAKTIKVREVAFKAPKGSKYPKKELKQGLKVEKEHTNNKKVRTIIAENHLDEDRNYYKNLKKVERKKK